MSAARQNQKSRHLRRFKPYPKYKYSGVEWLGEIPEHWEILPLKREFSVCLGKMLQRTAKRHLAVVVKVREAIDRMKEHRTALISAAVTGKIDVREEKSK
ncbi:MAG: hypothetical protein AB1512_29240 [Thermodesulfobacteriota bacterium]